jgi:hypothetical protein
VADDGAELRRHEPTAIVLAYFERMRARDPSVVELFHEDARLVGLGKVTQGRPAIEAFYRHVIETAGPTPRIVGDPLAAGPRVAVEIVIELAGGASVHAIDLFVVEDGRIRSLSYFLETH